MPRYRSRIRNDAMLGLGGVHTCPRYLPRQGSVQSNGSRKHHRRVPASRSTDVRWQILGWCRKFYFWSKSKRDPADTAAVPSTLSRQCAVLGSVRSLCSSDCHIFSQYIGRSASCARETFFSNDANEIPAKRRKYSA